MSLFGSSIKKQNPVVIVEIGNDWLKLLEGHARVNGIVMTKAGFRKLAQINEGVEQAITIMWKMLKLSKKNVLTYIPRHLLTVRLLELPSTNLREIGAMIQLQIGKQTPYSKEEIVFSYKVIPAGKEGYTKVMLVIANRNIVNERLDTLQRSGLDVKHVSFSSEGIQHWFRSVYLSKMRLDDHQSVVLVDIDSNFSDFMVFNKRTLIFSKHILIGANHFELNRGMHQEKFVDELRHSLDLYNEEWKGIKPAKLFFSGAAQGIREDLGVVSAKMEVLSEIINPLKDVQLKNNGAMIEEGRFKSVSLSASLGFFIENQNLEFNLLSHEVRIQRTMEDKRKSLTVVGILFAAIILTLSISILIHFDNKNVRLTQVKQQIEKLKEISSSVEKKRLLIDLFKSRMDAKGDPLNLFNDIYSVTPSSVYLTEITIQRKGSISMKGRATAMSEVFKFVNLLENLPNLQSVQNNYATMNKETKDEYSTDFEITAVYTDAVKQ